MSRFPWWIVWFAILVVLAVALNQWAYDGDAKCLIAECRRVK